ncbi:MAG TPA: type I methionyl aminopeptidase [Candidatus Bathyarchaeia archaeon]|nr:type I methionyl aminopeptidase [Candidatus Bathyarchaeia archaeon]
MKIPVKTTKETALMIEGGKKLARVARKVLKQTKPGVKLDSLNQSAENSIYGEKGEPSFKKVPNYHWATCININDGVVHGIPGAYKIQEGDLVSLDLGMVYRGYHTDMARTICVRSQKSPVLDFVSTRSGKSGIQKDLFLEVGKKALKQAIKAARAGNRVGDISQSIEKVVKGSGFYPVENLTGHGIGKNLHEAPSIPCFLADRVADTLSLKTGMALAIEVIYTQRKTDLYITEDGWTVRTRDGSLAALFEDTVLITDLGSKVITR